MKNSPWRALVWICLQLFISFWLATPLSAEEKIDSARIRDIAAMLPLQRSDA